jgi:hypothetical protein
MSAADTTGTAYGTDSGDAFMASIKKPVTIGDSSYPLWVVAVMTVFIIIIIYYVTSHLIDAINAIFGNKSSFMVGVTPGLKTYPLGHFGPGWGVGTFAAFQGGADMKLCGKGEWLGRGFVTRVDNGDMIQTGTCYKEGSTIINPSAANPAPSVSGYKVRSYKKPAVKSVMHKSGFDPKNSPEDFAGCSDMWGYDADAELGLAVSMGSYGSSTEHDDLLLERNLKALE